MELNCPNCGSASEVPGLLIPGARVTTTCPKCGSKFGGTVPARPDARRGAPRSNEDRGTRSGESRRRRGRDRRDAKKHSPEARTPLRVVAKGLDSERLAKLVASDMLLYNREKIERTLREGRLLSSMAAEIVEAWEFYKGRVGEETAKGEPHFRDAMNSILGGGDPIL